MTFLEINNLSIRYHDSSEWALKRINFTAEKGELIIVAGSSGCGKSTLAQTILGLIPTFVEAEILGEIRIEERTLNDLSRKKIIQTLGYVPQYPADYTVSLLVEEEVAFSLENLKFTRKEINTRITQVLDQLDIPHLRYRLITELSSGELQRVALATTLASQPPILILDEPMARIDPKSEIKLTRILKNLSKKGHLVLAFEHRLDYLLPLADRLLLLENGKLIADDEPKVILNKIKNIDLPEVSEVNFTGINHQILDINEAKMLLLKELSEL